MELRNLLKKKNDISQVANALYLDHLRYIKFLENSRKVMNLLDDGREKACGEYILDVHYVEALIEETIKYLGRMVFDACMIRQKGGEALFRRYDEERDKARSILLNIRSNVLPAAGAKDEDPEYTLLNAVLNSFFPEEPTVQTGVTALIYDLINHMMTRTVNPKFPFNQTPFWVIPCQGLVHHIHRLPTGEDRPLTGPLSPMDIPSRPLRVMIRDAAKENGPAGVSDTPARWAAICDGPYLGLSLKEGNRILCQVDVCLSGDRELDYIFIFMHERLMPEPLIPEGFETAQPREGLLAWCYNRSTPDMENLLVRLGDMLFVSPRGLEQIISTTKETSHA